MLPLLASTCFPFHPFRRLHEQPRNAFYDSATFYEKVGCSFRLHGIAAGSGFASPYLLSNMCTETCLSELKALKEKQLSVCDSSDFLGTEDFKLPPTYVTDLLLYTYHYSCVRDPWVWLYLGYMSIFADIEWLEPRDFSALPFFSTGTLKRMQRLPSCVRTATCSFSRLIWIRLSDTMMNWPAHTRHWRRRKSLRNVPLFATR